MELDHVVIAVADLEVGAACLHEHYGLAALAGGRHPGWGTANAIVPLGDAYLELVAVVDAREADASAFGRWIAAARAAPLAPLGWAVRIASLDHLAGRLQLAVRPGSRTRPDGRVLRWRLAGVEQAAACPALPFVVEWGEGTPFPGRAPTQHPAGPVSLARLELRGDPERLAGWLGEAPPAVVAIRAGEPALERVVLHAAGRQIVLEKAPT